MNSNELSRRSIRWGIIGPGDIAATFVKALQRADRATCVAVASRSIERAEKFAETHGIPRTYGSYEALVEDTDIDVVYVATPQSLHHRHARLALEHGRGVLVEKPMTMTRHEAEDLVELATDRGLFLMEGLWTLCNPLVHRVSNAIHSGSYGALESMLVTCGPLALPPNHRALDATAGGGFYREVLIYPLAVWLTLTNLEPISDVHAVGRSLGTADYSAAVTLELANGVYANVSGAFSRGARRSASSPARLLFENGWAELDDVFKPSTLRIAAGSHSEQHTLGFDADEVDFEYEIAEVIDAISSNRIESRSVPHALSLGLAELLDRIATQLHPRP